MHFVGVMRGPIRQMEEQKALMRAQRFPFKFKNLKTGKEKVNFVAGTYRPMELFEYIFPEPSLPDVLGGMQISGPVERPEGKAIGWFLRKALKLYQVPKLTSIKDVTGYIPKGTIDGEAIPAQKVHQMLVDGVAIYPIGLRDDITKDYKFTLGDGSEVEYHQEGL
ncbi:hypothetical protein LCGC14_2340760 [marine sediment metagenome]|uniref:Uncharacterized protein n=1 Tax=marine sediment metagenome TaxID=412755 RepID=A0A0F9EPU6_9ZZZZ